MSLLSEIKKDQLQARKNKNTDDATLLTTLIGEAAMIGKNDGNRETTDNEVVAVIKKFIKNNNELIAVVNPETYGFTRAIAENDFLTQYLPSQMTEEEIRAAVQSHMFTVDEVSPKIMGVIMKWLKDNYAGQYDGKMASKIVGELLNGR